MSSKIYKLEEIDFNRITRTNVDKKSDIPLSYILYDDEINGETPLVLETPYIYLTNDIVHLNNDFINYEILLSLISNNKDHTKLIRGFFYNLDKTIIQLVRNDKDKFNFSSNDIKYKALIRNYENNDNDENILKIKLHKSKIFTTNVFDENKNLIRSTNYKNIFKEGSYCKLILEVNSIWINKNVFGLYLKPHQIKIKSNLGETVDIDPNENILLVAILINLLIIIVKQILIMIVKLIVLLREIHLTLTRLFLLIFLIHQK